MSEQSAENALLDDSLDLTVGADGERGEPLDHKVRDLAALAYLVVTCEALGIEPEEEWDSFIYARAIHRRVRAALSRQPSSPPLNDYGFWDVTVEPEKTPDA